MKKFITAITTVLLICLCLSSATIAAASCKSPSSAKVECNKTNGIHCGIASVSGIKSHTGSNMWNTVTVSVDVYYKIKSTGDKKWTGYTSKTAASTSATSVRRNITPALDEAIKARGKWACTCMVCGNTGKGTMAS